MCSPGTVSLSCHFRKVAKNGLVVLLPYLDRLIEGAGLECRDITETGLRRHEGVYNSLTESFYKTRVGDK